MSQFSCDISRTIFFNLALAIAVAAELLSAQTADAKKIDAWAAIRGEGALVMAKAPALRAGGLWSRGAFVAAIPPIGFGAESYGYAIAPYGYEFYPPASYPAYGGVGCGAYFDSVSMANASQNALEDWIPTESNDSPLAPVQSPPIAQSSPSAFASKIGGIGIDDAVGSVTPSKFDEPAAPVFCPTSRHRKEAGLILAIFTPHRYAAGLCRREIDGERDMQVRSSSSRLCEWQCEARADERLQARFCPLLQPGNELEFARFDFYPQRAEPTIWLRASGEESWAAELGGTPRQCGQQCDKAADATPSPSAGFCPRWRPADALELAPERPDARGAGAMPWRIAFGGNREVAEISETPRLCARLPENSAGLCVRPPQQNWPELARTILDQRVPASTCRLQEDGEGAAAALRETPRLCEWRREPRVPAGMAVEFCPNPRRTTAVQRAALDFSPVRVSVTAANICRRVACTIVAESDDIPTASLSKIGDRPELPAQTPREPGVIDLGRAQPKLAVWVANGPGVWPAVATGAQPSYCLMGPMPLMYGQLFLYASTSPVPEPSTWALMLAALLGLGFVGLRRRPRGGDFG